MTRYTFLRFLTTTWRIIWSGFLRFLLGRDWTYKSWRYPKIRKIRSYPRDHLFFPIRELENSFAQVWVPDGVLIQPMDSTYCIYEIYVLDVYDKLYNIQSNDVIIDIGAHVGNFTLKASRRAENGLIVAIEPHPLNFKILVKNIKLNEIENVIPLNIALADYNNLTKLYISKTSEGHSILPNRTREKRFVKVKARTLDSVINELGIEKVNFIKADVEGAELKVLMGAQKVLKSNKNLSVAIAAYHYPEESQEVSRFLASMGFKVSSKSYSDGSGVYVHGTKP